MASALPITPLYTSVCCSILRKPGASLNSEHAVVTRKRNVILQCPELRRLSSLCREGRIQEAIVTFNETERRNIQIGAVVYGEILQACTNQRDRSTGLQVHARIVKAGELFSWDEYINTKVLIFYAKCDVPDVAGAIFRRMKVRNEFTWAVMIGLYCKEGHFAKALMGHGEMLENGMFADNFVVPNVLKACGGLMLIQNGKTVHGYALKMGFVQCMHVASSIVGMYGKCGDVEDAQKMFDGMHERNAVVWNSLIVRYAQNGSYMEALRMFYEMRIEGVEPTQVTISSFLSAAAILGAVEEGKQGHAITLSRGLELDDVLGTSMINFYMKGRLIEDAELIFERMVCKDMVTWNLMVSGYVQHGLVEAAIDMCRRMTSENLRYDSVTLVSLLSASAMRNDLKLGKEAHCYSIRNDLESDPVIASKIVDMYSACDRIGSARLVFENAPQIDLVVWNTLISSYAKSGSSDEALELIDCMRRESVKPDVVSWNSLIHGFLNDGKVDEARKSFSQMERQGIQQNHVTWTTLISGLGHCGFYGEAIQTFVQMQDSGIKPNVVSIVAALLACRGSESLHYGRAIHGYTLRHDWNAIPEISTSMLDMYAKVGQAGEAQKYFDAIAKKGLAVYNAMIACNAAHGRAREALRLYQSLRLDGFQPDGTTFTSILTACSHLGLVEEAMVVLNEMIDDYRIRPSIEHYGCVVGLLCRCGHLEEALMTVHGMPYKPDVHILGSLVTACIEKGEVELGEDLLQQMIGLDPRNPGNFVALSNFYATVERWDRVSETRNTMREMGLRKSPGCSWIQIGDAAHMFVAGDKSQEEISRVRRMLALLDAEMRSIGPSNVQI